jgi:hypothetical protein
VAEHLPTKCVALSSIPISLNQKKRKEKKEKRKEKKYQYAKNEKNT